MLSLTEIVYLAAPFGRPEERAFNGRLAELIRSYNFPLFMPQEAQAEIETAGHNGASGDRLLEVCLEVLNRTSLVVSVFYGEAFDPMTAFEVGYALGRRHNVIAIQNSLDPALSRPADLCLLPIPNSCARVVVAPHEDERFVDCLIPIMNRYFVPHRPL